MSLVDHLISEIATPPTAVVDGGGGTPTDLNYAASPTGGTVTSSTGTNALLTAATGVNAGLFLPAEKTKLTGIATGAEVNVNADWNAVSGDARILNKPTLGTAAAANTTAFATAAQGTLADSALQPSDIGVTVQPFGVSSLTYFSESQNTSAPNDTTFVHAFSAVDGGATNIDVAIAPKGTGSFALNIADGTTAGGDKRGLYSVDLQLVRDQATQVATGVGAFLAGASNTGSGDIVFGGGYFNSFSDRAAGGWGENNNFGGYSGGWGEFNTVSGAYSGGWGRSNLFSGAFSGGWGTTNTANAPFCNVFGNGAHSHGRQGTTAIAATFELIQGDTQLVLGVLQNKTTNATPTALTSDSSSTVSAANTIAFSADGVYGITFNLTAKNPGTSQCGMWLIQVWAVVHLGNLTTPGVSIQAIGTPTLPVTIDSSVVAINTTFDSVYLNVTGIASTNIKWVATYSMNENRD